MLTDKQIQDRIGAITGTRAAIIEGKNRFGGDLYTLWSVMTGRSNDDIKSSLMMRLGHYTEPGNVAEYENCLLYTSPSPRDATLSRMPSSA